MKGPRFLVTIGPFYVFNSFFISLVPIHQELHHFGIRMILFFQCGSDKGSTHFTLPVWYLDSDILLPTQFYILFRGPIRYYPLPFCLCRKLNRASSHIDIRATYVLFIATVYSYTGNSRILFFLQVHETGSEVLCSWIPKLT